MKISVGEWRTRDGRKAIVVAQHPTGNVAYPFAGWIEQSAEHWTVDGRWFWDDESECDLIEPWTDPVPWDWSATPPWLNCLIQGPSGQWYLCDEGVEAGNDGIRFGDFWSISVPRDYSPKWSGDWRNSKTMRPGYNGGAK